MILAFCTSADGPLSMYQVSFSYLVYFQRYDPDKLFIATRMVVHEQLVEPAVFLSGLYDVFLLDIVRDTRQNLWTMIYKSQ